MAFEGPLRYPQLESLSFFIALLWHLVLFDLPVIEALYFSRVQMPLMYVHNPRLIVVRSFLLQRRSERSRK